MFVAHSFRESADCLRVVECLESMERFFCLNVSNRDNLPESGGLDSIKEELVERVAEHIELNECKIVNSLRCQSRFQDTSCWVNIVLTFDRRNH